MYLYIVLNELILNPGLEISHPKFMMDDFERTKYYEMQEGKEIWACGSYLSIVVF